MSTPAHHTPRPIVRLALGVFFFVAIAGAGVSVWRMAHWLTVDGGNTVGEAGKVYFAARFAEGKTIFVSGDEPPHYASMHGALLHATVGMIARVGGLGIGGMYAAGRAISVIGTLVALAFAVAILRRTGASWWACAGAVIAFLVPEAIVQHAVSYRPDHWNLALAAGACWLLVDGRGKGWRLFALAVIPGVAFFIKAPGAALMASVALGYVVGGEGKRGIAAALLSVGVLVVMVGCVALAAGDAFVGGLRSGMQMPMAAAYLRSILGEAPHAMVWFSPVVVAIFGLPTGDDRGRMRRVAGVFFVVSFVAAAVSALRAGGGPYYFVEATLWAIVLTASWADEAIRGGNPGSGEPGLWWLLICAGIWVMPIYNTARDSFPIGMQTQRMDTAVRITYHVGADRQRMADFLNHKGLFTFSDDASLNIMLDKPAVIYPLLAALQANGGEAMAEPVRAQAYDAIVLSGIVSNYMGVPNLPPAFVDAVKAHYVPVDAGTRYMVFVPKREER